MVDTVLKNVQVFGETTLTDLAIEDGYIVERGAKLDHVSGQEIDVNGRVVVPGFVDPHVHLDIALMNPWKTPGRQQPFRTFQLVGETLDKLRRGFTGEDIQQRASAALELASRHGITALRAQCHVDNTVGLKHLEALLKVKEQYADRVTVQIVVYPEQGLLGDASVIDHFREAFHIGADVMGCSADLDCDDSGQMRDFRKHIDAALNLAMEFDVDLDMHADLAIPDSIELDEFEVVYAAKRVMEVGYQGRVTAGHICALGSASPDVAQQVIGLIKEARISVISQPDMYRLGREDKQHVRRGLTRVKELLNAGVNVTFASNNVRDTLRPMGNFNPLEEALILAYGAHMDTVEELNTLLAMSTYNGAKAMGLKNYGLDVGCQADLVVLDAFSPSAAIVGLVEKNFVFKAGRLMASSRVVSETYNGSHFLALSQS
jgi:cytosine/creatinine deaminase